MDGLRVGPMLKSIESRLPDLDVVSAGGSGTAGAGRGRRRSTESRREIGGRDVWGRGSERVEDEKLEEVESPGEASGRGIGELASDADEDRLRRSASRIIDAGRGRVTLEVDGYLVRATRGASK